MDTKEISKQVFRFLDKNIEKLGFDKGQKYITKILDQIKDYIDPIFFEQLKIDAKKHFSDSARRHCGREFAPRKEERQKSAFDSTCRFIISECEKFERG